MVKNVWFVVILFLLLIPLAYSLTIDPINPKNNSIIYKNSTWFNISTDGYGNCSYSFDSNSFAKFNSSTASNWKLETSTKLDLSEDLATGGINRELLSNITTFIDKNNLKGLDTGNVTNRINSSKYNQYLYLLGPAVRSKIDSGYVVYNENDDDVTADFLYFKSGSEIGRYLLEFEAPFFQSYIYNSSGSQTLDGLFLTDYENVTLKIFGKNYNITSARRTSIAGNGVNLILNSGTDKLELKDTNIKDVDSTSSLKVNDNSIDDAYVVIEGLDDNSTFKITRIHINMTADDNFYVSAGSKLSDVIKSEGGTTAEPEVLFTQNWNIAYKGLKNENTEKIKLKTSGTSQYTLQFVDGAGYNIEVPIATSSGGANISFGNMGKDFVNVEAWNISKDDYLAITNGTAIRGSRPTYILQYKGADKISVDGHIIKFKNLGSGANLEINYTNSTPLAYVNLTGTKNGIYLAAGADINLNDFDIRVDLDGDGILGNDTNSNTILTTRYGAEINLTNQSESNFILLSIRTPDEEKDISKNITNIETVEAIINVTNGSGNTTVNTKETVRIYLQNNTYYLEFKDRSGDKPNLPIAENSTNNNIFFGQINKSLINKETGIINKYYYFIVSSSLDARDKRSTYALQYLGADKVTADSPVLRFKNLGSGQTFQQTYSDGTPLATLKLGGQDFKVFKSPNADVSVDDFDIQIDLDANGSLSSDNGYTVPITTYPKGVEINITNETLPNTVQLTIRTFDTIINETVKAKDNVDTLYPSILKFSISASNGSVNHIKSGNLNFRVPSGQINAEYAYTSYGTYIKREFPTGQPATLDIDYPEKQREPLVYYENAGEHTEFLSDLSEGQHNIQINCTDILDNSTNFYLVFNFTKLPNVTSHYPSNGSVNVSIKSNIIVNFSKNIDKSTFKKSTFSVKELNGKDVSGVFNYNTTINQLIFDPANFLEGNTYHIINVTANIKDSTGNNLDKTYVWNFLTAKKDIDDDGMPDDEDNDIDNDGIDDNIDFFRGNLSNLNSNFPNISMKIDSDSNFSKVFNGTKKIEFFKGEIKLLEFDYSFANSTKLDLSNISILNASNSSLGGVVVRGISLSKFGWKKTTYVERIDSSKNGLCIKDAEIDWIDNISSSCDGENEYKVECDGSSQNGYICTYNSTMNAYRVTGLSHSGALQLEYTQSSGSSSSSSGGSSGGGGSGGGGGGGGGAAGFICNMDWKCGDWSECKDGIQTRQCEFAKVPQHWQEIECPSQSNLPQTSKECESKETKPTEAKQLSASKPAQSANISKSNAITGAVVAKNNKPNYLIGIIGLLAISVAGFFIYRKLKA